MCENCIPFTSKTKVAYYNEESLTYCEKCMRDILHDTEFLDERDKISIEKQYELQNLIKEKQIELDIFHQQLYKDQ